MKETFGQRLARLRKEKGLTQEDIANRISISPQAVSKWENDLSTPDIYVLSSLADILGVTVDELLGRDASEETKEEENKTVDSEVVDDDEKINDDGEKEEHVRFDENGIHVETGTKSVNIDESGIHVRTNEDSHDYSWNKRRWLKKESIWEIIGNGIIWGLALIGFVLMGVLWTEYNIGWRIGWVLFLVAILVSSGIEAVRKRRFCVFAYPVAVIAAYCLLGILGDYYGFEGWSFYWFLFITIPAYYMIFGPIDRLIHRKEVFTSDDD